jgi:hypothetical protein
MAQQVVLKNAYNCPLGLLYDKQNKGNGHRVIVWPFSTEISVSYMLKQYSKLNQTTSEAEIYHIELDDD